jgi:hypothetical protein
MADAPQWQEVDVELRLVGPALDDGYTEIQAWVDFEHSSGRRLRRPVFWDGGDRYRVRFASPEASGTWSWTAQTDRVEHPLSPDGGELTAVPGDPDDPHGGRRHGFATIAPGARTMTYADGSPAVLVADTAWAMPFRARLADVEIYARDRQAKGFNAVFLMVVQPDMHATGPTGRNVDLGFEVGFSDLADGHLTEINHDYFRYFDGICDLLLAHGLTPVLQPVFHGYGWKGQSTAGPVVPPTEYARFCRYLVARYGARPAVYLVCGDGTGLEPTIEAGGTEIEAWDDYQQPTGIHYRPHSRARAHQDADWLDFQSCQTGHDGDHVPDRLATMWAYRPVKAIMNGEPSYENSGRRGKASGWWQGHEAWSNLCAGGLLGVVYGAGSLWQWRIGPDEPGHQSYFLDADSGWREALDFEGSRYVGLVGTILDGLPLADAEPCWDVLTRTRGLIVEGSFFLSYAENGGPWLFLDADGRIPDRYWIIDPRTAEVVESGIRPANSGALPGPEEVPRILICSDTVPAVAARHVTEGLGDFGLPRPTGRKMP